MSPTADRPAAPAALDRRRLTAFLAMLVGRQAGGLLETRARCPNGMHQRFYALHRLSTAASDLLERAQHTDVYVGCAPRIRPAGDRSALGQIWTLWVDCDSPEAVARLDAFAPAPPVLVRSGTATNAHAYWPLLHPITADQAAFANARLARALGADERSAEPARILRPPGTHNHKHDPPTAVGLIRLRPTRRYGLTEITAALPELPTAGSGQTRPSRRGRVGDDLLKIPPPVYVLALTGQQIGRDHKIRCPFHEDHSPSLHVYDTPKRGWYCFSCQRGGTIYDLAAHLDRVTPRGREFLQLRERLTAALPSASRPATEQITMRRP